MPDLYVDGSWVSARSGGRRTITCPADGTVVGEVDEAGREDTAAAIAAAHRAFHDGPWPDDARPASAATCCCAPPTCSSATPTPSPRPSRMDTGKRLVESEYDVADVVSVFRHYGRIAAEDAGRLVDTGNADVVSRVVHEPLGVCGLIAPWNYPLLQAVLEGRALPGRRQHLRAQAQRAHPAHEHPPDAAARGGRAARRASATSSSAPGRAPARRWPRTRASTWCRSPAASRPAAE